MKGFIEDGLKKGGGHLSGVNLHEKNEGNCFNNKQKKGGLSSGSKIDKISCQLQPMQKGSKHQVHSPIASLTSVRSLVRC